MSPSQVKEHIRKFYMNYVNTKYNLSDWSHYIYTTENAYPHDLTYHKYYIFSDQHDPHNYYLSVPDYIFSNYEILGDKILDFEKLSECCTLYINCTILYKYCDTEYASRITLQEFLARYDAGRISIAKDTEAYKNKYVSRFLLREDI